MRIEDKRQQESLKNFDQVLKESTGQLVWLLYWLFAAMVLMLGLMPIYDGIDWNRGWALICYVCTVVWMDIYVLAPYCWSNESFSQRIPRSDSVSKILKYVPLTRKNYIQVRMEYLWKFIWKFGAFAMLIVIGSMGFTQAFSVVKAVEGILLFLIGPMLIGYIGLKGEEFSESAK